MKTSVKAATLAAALLFFLLGGCWISGKLLFIWFGFDNRQPGLFTWLQYFHFVNDPRYAAYATKIKATGVAGLGLSLLLWLGMVLWMFRSPRRSTHGDARFADSSDLAKAGLTSDDPTGVLIGRLGRTYLRDKGQRFIVLAAPTRSGKGVGVVVPVLLDYRQNVVVLDIKQENYDLTSGYRRSLGQEVFMFSPFATNGATHRWNPLRYVSEHPGQRVGDLRAIAQMLYPDGDGTGNQQFFTDHARNVFLALCLYLFESYDQNKSRKRPLPYPTFGQLYRTSAGNGSDLKQHLSDLAGDDRLSDVCRTAFAGFLSQAQETFSSIMGTFNAPLTAWADPLLDAATSADDFDLREVRRRPMSIYLCVSPNKLSQAALVFNLFFSQLINENTKALPSQDSTLTRQCLLLMDEFTSIGAVDIIAHAVSYMAGYNLRLLPIIQSMAQLDATYGKERARTIITNHATQIVYAPREQQDANDYSEMLGYTTVRRRQYTQGKDRSYTEVEDKRALMLPQELKAMGSDREILIIEGMAHPALVDKIRYYQEDLFTQRLLPPAPLPTRVPLHTE